MVRRLALQLWTCRDHNKPPVRAWARGLGISHVWLQTLELAAMIQRAFGQVTPIDSGCGWT